MPLRVAAALLLLAAPAARAADGWDAGEPRPFLAARLEAGLHARALGYAGWGKPHSAWAGAQAAAFVTARTRGAELALRGALPFVDLQLSLRQTRSFARPILEARTSHAEAELSGGHARLTVVEADLLGYLPAPAGLLAWEAMWVRPLDLRAGAHAFEETWQVAVAPQGAALARLGWLAGPLLGGRARLGPFGEAVRLLGRGDAVVWRAGGALSVAIAPHLSAVAFGLAPVSGPDRFRAFTGTYGMLALRWSVATGDPRPPWP